MTEKNRGISPEEVLEIQRNNASALFLYHLNVLHTGYRVRYIKKDPTESKRVNPHVRNVQEDLEIVAKLFPDANAELLQGLISKKAGFVFRNPGVGFLAGNWNSYPDTNPAKEALSKTFGLREVERAVLARGYSGLLGTYYR